MQFIKVKTRPFLPPKDDIYDLLDNFLPRLKEGDVLVITSKVLGIHEGRCVPVGKNKAKKDKLILRESDAYIPRQKNKYNVTLSIKDCTLAAAAGIDESNGNGYYILWPRNASKLAKEICVYLKEKYRLAKLAIIVTDSRTVPLRWGVTGVSTGCYGLEPLKDYRGKKDIFGRKLVMTQANVADAVASIAVLLMGESNEKTPFLILRGADFIRFTDKETYGKLTISPSEDLYAPIFKVFKFKKPQ